MKIRGIIILTVVLFVNLSCKGQISTIKEFDDNEYICSYVTFEEVPIFATFNRSNNEVKIYNSNINLLRTIPLKTANYFSLVQIYGLSKDVFNSDEKFEFIIQKIDETGVSNTQIINEENKIIKDFGKNSVLLRTIGNKNYIVESESKYDYQSSPVKINQTDKLHLLGGKFRRIIY